MQKLEEIKLTNRKRSHASANDSDEGKSLLDIKKPKLKQQTLVGSGRYQGITKEHMRKLVTDYVINDIKSLRSVESPSFKAIVRAGCP